MTPPQKTEPSPTLHRTLLDELDEAATQLDAFGRYLLANGLRAASQRLREEMERAKLHPFVPGAVVVALNYINGGPLGTEGSDER